MNAKIRNSEEIPFLNSRNLSQMARFKIFFLIGIHKKNYVRRLDCIVAG